MLTLEKRPCKIGTSINTRREMHGDEPVPAMDIPLSGIMLEPFELNSLVDMPHFWDLVFNERPDKLPEPIWAKKFKEMQLLDKFKDSQVILYVGLKIETIALVNCKLAKIKLAPQIGGLTELSLSVQCTPEMQIAAHLFEFLDKTAEVAVEIGDLDATADANGQPELPLHVMTDDSGANLPANVKPKKTRSRTKSATVN